MAVSQTITALPQPPSTSDVDNFNDRADEFLAALPTMVTQTNTVISQMNATENNVNNKEESAVSSAQTATEQAGIATTKASEASNSATAAHDAQLAAEAVFDNFDDKYLGAKATDPTVDNDGDPLVTGALYFRTTAPKGIYVYDAELSVWSIFSYVPTSHGTLSGRSNADAHPMDAITGLLGALGLKANSSDMNTALALKVDKATSGLSQGVTTQDPNLAADEYILTRHTNGPDASNFYHIRTQFYSTQTSSAARMQIAVSYSAASTLMYVRHYYSSTWTPWVLVTKDETPFMQVEYQLASGTNPVSAVATTWTTEPLNTITDNYITGASLASNQITLPAGTYQIDAEAVVGVTGASSKFRIATTAGTTVAESTSNGSRGYPINNGNATMSGRLTSASAITIKLQYWASSANANALGYPSASGDVEVYARVKIWKVA